MTPPPTWAVAVVATLALAASSCDETEQAPPPTVTLAPRPTPVDSTNPDEIAEGTVDAFGFMLPRRAQIDLRFPDAVHAHARLPFEGLANYVRDRVDATRVETGAAKTVFVDAEVKGKSGKRVAVEVVRKKDRVLLVVRNRERPPMEPGLTEEERWQRAGLTKDGRVLPEQNK